jgi:c-di-GMP-binding flagellar brake protein YcgR
MASEDDAGAPPAEKTERRNERRHTVDGTAVLHLLDPFIHLRGRILDLSLNGCQFRTEDCFRLGIYRRVEIEFQVDGLPFRLIGVTQSVHNLHKVGVRFLDVSERKRQQLIELIAEIEERAARPDPDSP